MPKLLVGLAALLLNLIVLSPTANGATSARQLIVVSADSATDTAAALTAYELSAKGSWRKVVGPVDARLGAEGMGKPEDNVWRTPVGTFALDEAFGRLPDPGTAMPYTQVTAEDWWDAYPSSPTYNTLVHQAESPGEGSENLYDSGEVYDYAVNIAHNPRRVPGRAAGMFLHVTDGQPTQGCVAVDLDSMKTLLTWLDPQQQPKIIIGVGATLPSA